MIVGFAALSGIDQYAKHRIDQKFCTPEEKRNGDDRPLSEDILNGKVKLRKFYNKGIAFSKFTDHPDTVKKVSIAGTAVILVYFIIYMFHREPSGFKWALTFILSGALSNMIDRVRHGYVIDYFSVNTDKKKKKTLIYNLGDIFIFIGAAITVITVLFTSEK